MEGRTLLTVLIITIFFFFAKQIGLDLLSLNMFIRLSYKPRYVLKILKSNWVSIHNLVLGPQKVYALGSAQ